MVTARRKLLWLAALPLLLLPGCVAALGAAPDDQTLKVDGTPVISTAQDSTGTVWGVDCPKAKLLQWQTDHWAPAPPANTGSGLPCGIWNAPDGGVIVDWNTIAGEHNFTWHRGSQFKRLGDLHGVTSNFKGFATPPGDFWLVTGQQEIYQLMPEGGFRKAYTFSPTQFFPYQHVPQGGSVIDSILAIPAGKGQTWFWGMAFGRFINDATLEGLLVYDGKSFQYHRTIPGLPDEKLSYLGAAGGGKVWAGVLAGGLYSIDVQTLTAAPVQSPLSNDFRQVTQVFTAGKDLYAVTNPPVPWVSESMEHRLSSVLWRRRQGQWEKALNGMDDLEGSNVEWDRPWMPGHGGLWIGSLDSGLWWMPGGGASPLLINWKQGFPLESVTSLYRLPGSRMLAVDWLAKRAVAVPQARLMAAAPEPKRVQVINPYSLYQADARFHIWGVTLAERGTLDEWDGEKWIHHPFAGNVKPSWISGLDADSEGRIWLFPDCRMGPMAILDTKTMTWTPYPSYQDALQTAGQRPIQLVNPDMDRMKPIYGPNHQIAYMGACQGINYFNGSRWSLWNRYSVPGDQRYFFDGPAYFDAAGRLAVNIHGATWEVSPQGVWQAAAFEPEPERLVRVLAAAPPRPPPAGCSVTGSTSLATDRLGRAWWTWNDRLYTGVTGECRAVFDAGQPDPFADGRLLGHVLIDHRGNAFIETVLSGGSIGEYALVKMPGALPHTTIALSAISADRLRATFKTSAAEKHRFVWRLDGGAWSAPEERDYADFDSLPGGTHVIEAATVTANLMMDAIPARATTAVNAEPKDQIAALIARLTGAASDDQRQAAIDALKRQPPKLALAALHKARDTATDEARWWIDAAIQAMEPPSRQ
jgi:hypothetical protein